jgi:hypothetical protein
MYKDQLDSKLRRMQTTCPYFDLPADIDQSDHTGLLEAELDCLSRPLSDRAKMEHMVLQQTQLAKAERSPTFTIRVPRDCPESVKVLRGTNSTRLRVEINLLFDVAAIMDQLDRTVWSAQNLREALFPWVAPALEQGTKQGRPSDWGIALRALGTYRLRKTGLKFVQIARQRNKSATAIELPALEQAAKRDVKLVNNLRKTLFPTAREAALAAVRTKISGRNSTLIRPI